MLLMLAAFFVGWPTTFYLPPSPAASPTNDRRPGEEVRRASNSCRLMASSLFFPRARIIESSSTRGGTCPCFRANARETSSRLMRPLLFWSISSNVNVAASSRQWALVKYETTMLRQGMKVSSAGSKRLDSSRVLEGTAAAAAVTGTEGKGAANGSIGSVAALEPCRALPTNDPNRIQRFSQRLSSFSTPPCRLLAVIDDTVMVALSSFFDSESTSSEKEELAMTFSLSCSCATSPF
mmetsp:Transcript_20340/g.41664  ORF Transcript_20340/g.41664 Transcript_20340/m.41664 type:complete len:237 (-) Transcript_20340:839-1549(-)